MNRAKVVEMVLNRQDNWSVVNLSKHPERLKRTGAGDFGGSGYAEKQVGCDIRREKISDIDGR
jgi:hypothetical protein